MIRRVSGRGARSLTVRIDQSRIVVNSRQRENLAKYAYDLSKLMMAIPVLGNLVAPQFSNRAFWAGIVAASVFVVLGYLLDREPEY